MKTISRYIMTLALLLTAVTGAWAGGLEGRTFVDFKIEFRDNPYTVILPASSGLPDGVIVDIIAYNGEQHGVKGGTITVPVDGPVKFTIGACQYSQNEIGVKKDGEAFTTVKNQATCGESSGSFAQYVTYVYNGKAATLTFEFTGNTYIPYFFAEAVEGSIEVTWNASTKTGTFEMPAYDVEIAPIYAPVAQWAKVENVDQLPTAIEGIYTESTDAIVKAGTVAKIGETENLQGTLMYAVGTSATEQPALTSFSATLPTAEKIAAGDVYVWYYIKGVDAPEGTEATAENTFNDSEICATPLKVTVLNNKFDIQFKAANANTIEAGKATVTVGGAAATVTEGKLESVKMGSEVKLEAKPGYKFRKVEVKKGGLLSFEIGGHVTATIYYVEGETWEQAIQNHPEENSAWKINQGYISGNGVNLFAGDNFVIVNPNSTIDPNAGYHLLWT